MKVVIIHQHFRLPHPGGPVRSYYLASALAQRGHEVTIITAHNEPGYRKENFEGLAIHYLPIPYDNGFGFRKRIVSFLKFQRQSARLVVNVCPDAHICYAISTPLTTGLAAIRLRKRLGIPYIFEVGDLWPEAPIQMGFIRDPLLKAFLRRLERRIYRGALAVVALSPSIHDAIRRQVPDKTIYLLPNMADIEYFRPTPKDPSLEGKFGTTGKFVVSYVGAMGLANGLEYFLECAAECQRQKLPVQFLLCGDGATRERLKQQAEQHHLQNLEFIPFQNREGVRDVLNVTDAGFICYAPVPVLETGSPNKYFDALAAGKLIVVNFGGWIRDEVISEQCGIYANPKQPASFVEAIKPFLSGGLRLEAYQRAARRLAERKYSRAMLGDTYARMVSKALSDQLPQA